MTENKRDLRIKDKEIVNSLTFLFLEYIAFIDEDFNPKEKSFFQKLIKEKGLSDSLMRVMNFYGISNSAISDLEGIEQIVLLLIKDSPKLLLVDSIADTIAMLLIDGAITKVEGSALVRIVKVCKIDQVYFQKSIDLCFEKFKCEESFKNVLSHKDQNLKDLEHLSQKIFTSE